MWLVTPHVLLVYHTKPVSSGVVMHALAGFSDCVFGPGASSAARRRRRVRARRTRRRRRRRVVGAQAVTSC